MFDTVVSVNDDDNTITLSGNTWLTYGNVAFGETESGSASINILSYTGLFNIITNGEYYNDTNIFESVNPLSRMIFAGDTIKTNNDTLIVESVDYTNNVIYTTTNASVSSNTIISVKRNFSTTDVIILGQ